MLVSKNVMGLGLSLGLGFTVFSLVSSDNFFAVIYTFLSLVLTIDVLISVKAKIHYMINHI